MAIYTARIAPHYSLVPPQTRPQTYVICLEFEGEYQIEVNHNPPSDVQQLIEASLLSYVDISSARLTQRGVIKFRVEADSFSAAIVEFWNRVEQLEFLYTGFLEDADCYDLNISVEHVVRYKPT